MDNTREKLIEIVFKSLCNHIHKSCKLAENISDDLIANGVTVQDGKPLEAFLHPIDAYKGLKAKYLVFKSDTGEKVDNCFILRPDRDPAATEALRVYASATDNETLAEDIYNWVGKGESVQMWIPVSESPKERGCYFVNVKHWLDGRPVVREAFWNGADWLAAVKREEITPRVTHWMPLPQPPTEDSP